MAILRKDFRVNSASATQLVAGVASTDIRVWGWKIDTERESDKSVTYQFQDDESTPVTIGPQQTLAKGESAHKITCKGAHLGDTTSAADLDLLVGAAVPVQGYVLYELVAS